MHELDSNLSIETLYDDAIKIVGGYGLYQKMTTFLVLYIYMARYLIIFSFSTLLHDTRYQCLIEGEYTECTSEEICSNDYTWQFDSNNERYFYTWVE